MFAGSAYAFDPYDLQKLKDTGNCVNCDLRNADLRRTDLSGAILNRTNMRNNDMRNANMDSVLFCDTIMPDGSIRLTNAIFTMSARIIEVGPKR